MRAGAPSHPHRLDRQELTSSWRAGAAPGRASAGSCPASAAASGRAAAGGSCPAWTSGASLAWQPSSGFLYTRCPGRLGHAADLPAGANAAPALDALVMPMGVSRIHGSHSFAGPGLSTTCTHVSRCTSKQSHLQRSAGAPPTGERTRVVVERSVLGRLQRRSGGDCSRRVNLSASGPGCAEQPRLHSRGRLTVAAR